MLGLALAYGGVAQFGAGMWEFKRNNTFGATAFTSYGAFWMAFAILVIFHVGGIPAEARPMAIGNVPALVEYFYSLHDDSSIDLEPARVGHVRAPDDHVLRAHDRGLYLASGSEYLWRVLRAS